MNFTDLSVRTGEIWLRSLKNKLSVLHQKMSNLYTQGLIANATHALMQNRQFILNSLIKITETN